MHISHPQAAWVVTLRTTLFTRAYGLEDYF